MLTRYAAQKRRFREGDVWRAFTRAKMSMTEAPMSEAGAAALRDYREFAYKDALADEHEEVAIRGRVFDEAVEAQRDDMFDFVTERRAKALPVAIETFNKIQGRKLPSWNADIKLNLYKNPDTPTKH